MSRAPITAPTAAAYEALLGLEPAAVAGLVQLRRARSTGTLVGVYDALAAGIDDDPAVSWATVCEDHGTLVLHPTRGLAEVHAPHPATWCELCRCDAGAP